MEKINELKYERGKVVKKIRGLKEKAEERDLNKDEVTKFNNLKDEYDNLSQRINILEHEEEKAKKEVEKEYKKEINNNKEDGEYRDVFFKYARKGRNELAREERVTLNTQTGSEGGFLVPTQTSDKIIEKLRDSNFMWRFANVEQTAADNNITSSGNKPQFGWIDELGSYPTTDSSYGQFTIGAWKVGGILKVAEELLYDNTYDLESRLMNDFNNAARDKSEEAFVVGDGSSKPTGLITDAQVGETTSAVDAITFNEIKELEHSLRAPYRQSNGTGFVMNDNTALALRLIKNSNDQYVWQDSVQAGKPDRLLGYRVNYSTNMADMAADAKSIAFGDIGYYTIYVRRGIVMQRLNEKYADTGEVGFKTHMRVDGKLELPEAMQVLQMATA